MEEPEYLKLIEDWKLEHREEIEKGKVRKCFTNILPKFKNGSITWKLCNNYNVYFIYENISGWIKIVNYIGGETSKIEIEYNSNNFEVRAISLYKCYLGVVLSKRTKEFKIEIGTRFKDNKRDITITDRKYVDNPHNKGKYLKYYKYECNKCSFDCGKHYSIVDKEYKDELWIEENSLIGKNKSGCSCCCSPSKVVVENINSIYHTDKWMIPYMGDECAKIHTHGSNDNIYTICPDCGQTKRTTIRIAQIHKTHSIGCEICGDGVKYPNKFMAESLRQLEVDFIPEYTPEWIKPRRYDFYIPSKNIIIEMDGGLGHGNKIHPKDNKTIEESLEIDNYKDEQARLHGIEVIRIDCFYDGNSRFEYIKNNVKNKLKNILELKNINWLKCDEFALSNLIKIACNYKNSNPNLTTTEIGQLMGGYTRAGVSNWLYKGNELGWCNYDTHEEMVKSALNTGKANGKQVEVFKDGRSLGIFESGTDIARQSEKLFGVKLLQTCISDVCLGKAKYHKGFIFKYV